ncbi:uncharacterized protein EI90DRAFT_2093216 [Cantharellus anzutake]|uniref:uncharacterized protein n=1 Tax=Cantharellus anzutake TaxID=1750568 RepID=UPI00190559C7|nr:uncharacterized protein EI90DRAFT_2093216 [Cantharellus anzutake]KAF8340651.1 hypothetical protein EI90DRAFT_2093216 [Cantharellus anzutake]
MAFYPYPAQNGVYAAPIIAQTVSPYSSHYSSFDERESVVERCGKEFFQAKKHAEEAQRVEHHYGHAYQRAKEDFERRRKIERDTEIYYRSRGLRPPSYAAAYPPGSFVSPVTAAAPILTSPLQYSPSFVPSGPTPYVAPQSTPNFASGPIPSYPGGAYVTPGIQIDPWQHIAPAPAYYNVSPPPPNPFSLTPESTRMASQVQPNKWKTGKTSTLFQNERRPQELNSHRSTVHIHPMLSSVDGKTYPLIVDLARRRKDITSIEEPGTRWEDEEILSQPATLPRVTRLRLMSPKVMGPIQIVNRGGVTVNDVFIHLFDHFHQPIPSPAIPEESLVQLQIAYRANMRQWMGDPTQMPDHFRTVDNLYGEPIFDGLHADPDLVDEWLGERDAATLIMNFKSRTSLGDI